MPPIPPLVRKVGLNADVRELCQVLAATPGSQATYEALAERLASDAEFYGRRASDRRIAPVDRRRYQGLADALWREHEAARKAADTLATNGQTLAAEARAIARG